MLLSIACAFTMKAQNSDIKLQPEKPVASNQVQITYTGTQIGEGMTITARVFKLDRIDKAQTVTYTLSGNSATASFAIPDSATYILFEFTNNNKTDNLGINIYDKKGNPVKGTYLNEAQIKMKLAPKDFDQAMDLLEKEFKVHPQLKDEFIGDYLKAKYNSSKSSKAETAALAKELYQKKMKQGKNDKNISTLISYMSEGNEAKQDSLKQQVIKKYPNGEVALFNKIEDMFESKDPDKTIAIYNDIVQRYPAKDLEKVSRFLDSHMLGAYIQKMDLPNFEKCMAKQQSERGKAANYNEMAWKLYKENKDLDKAKEYAQKATEMITSSIAQQKALSTQEELEFKQSKGGYLDTYAAIIHKTGDKVKALEIQKEAVEMTQGLQKDVNQRLIQLLLDNKKSTEALSQSESFILNQKNNAKIDSMYKVAYIEAKGSDAGLKEAFDKLKAAEMATYKKKLKAEMTDNLAPDFTLKDLEGREVKLSDLKGHIVIIDFWATWCGPCKASMPGMQKAMHMLKDKKVKFLFVNAFENDSIEQRTAKIKKMLKDRNLEDLTVLLDESKDGKFAVSTAFGIQPIPAKVIVDKEGKIRFRAIGYSGDDELLINELATMVSILDEK